MGGPRRCLLLRVSGRVQGVCFRLYAKQEAERLGITGWVRNMADGSVAAMICGDGSQLAAMQAWMARGPSMAHVEDMQAKAVEDDDPPASFRIVY